MSEREARAHVVEMDECAEKMATALAYHPTVETRLALIGFRRAAEQARAYLRALLAAHRC